MVTQRRGSVVRRRVRGDVHQLEPRAGILGGVTDDTGWVCGCVCVCCDGGIPLRSPKHTHIGTCTAASDNTIYLRLLLLLLLLVLIY